MNVFTVIGLVGIGMVIFTALIAFAIRGLSVAVTNNVQEIEQGKNRFRPNQTFGFEIPIQADDTQKFIDARKIAARLAARQKRGANMRIGRKGHERLQTNSQDLKQDPMSAFKIAKFQGWAGLGEFSKYQDIAVASPAAPAAVATGPAVKRKLVAGKDYQVVPVTDGMSGPERRTTRIANAKAKSAAYKALKEAGADMVAAAPVAAAAAPVAAAPSVENLAAEAGIEEPVYIELTDDMDPADKRAARIANSKAKSAYKKALKAAGISATAAAAPAPAAAPAAPPAAPPPVAAPVVDAAVADIPKPDLVEITDDMDPSDKRQARIANSKAKSAYKKALKEAGIDPKTVKI